MRLVFRTPRFTEVNDLFSFTINGLIFHLPDLFLVLSGAGSYVTPYTYATLPQTATALPTAATAATAFTGLSPYTAAAAQAASLQEARLQ